MMADRPKKDLIEIFGYAPDDTSMQCRSLWKLSACPFINKQCTKSNHDGSIVYGTCSVSSSFGDCIICPIRLYENNYQALKKISDEVFGQDVRFLMYEDFIPLRSTLSTCVVALGQNSGKEVKVGRKLSMDWILSKIENGLLVEYVGVEVQSIDITGNYRDSWHFYKNISKDTVKIPSSEHGLNWANVHKRLIPQIIRKSVIYSKSSLVKYGMFFIVPDVVYRKFEEVIGKDIPIRHHSAKDVLTIHTYGLSPAVTHGHQRHLIFIRCLRFSLEEFSQRFIFGPNLPSGEELDSAVKRVLGMR